jgi:predicted ATPase
VFSDEWLAAGQDYINQFLNVAFAGKTPAQYEQENGRSNDDFVTTLKKLEGYHKDFFVVFAHVESPSGLWSELHGGRMQELAQNPLVQKYCLGFQKVRTHDKPDEKCRVKVQQWWGNQYPAEVEGSDPKRLDEIGRGEASYIQIGDLSFGAVKYALTDLQFRVSKALPKVQHSRVDAVRFEGGFLDGVRVPFSPHLNCLIGIQGSGKSSILESLRYALDIPFGEKAQDQEYKQALLPYVLKSGGKIVVEATDRHGTKYEIRRILGHQPDVYVDGKLRPGILIRETIIRKPLYFGQKDLSAAGKGFGQDLVEKLVGESLRTIRGTIAAATTAVKTTADDFRTIHSNAEDQRTAEDELRDVKFRLEQFDSHGVKEKLQKQVEFNRDLAYCQDLGERVQTWISALEASAVEAKECFDDVKPHVSQHNAELFERYEKNIAEMKKTVAEAGKLLHTAQKSLGEFIKLRKQLETTRDGLKDDFAETERQLVKALESQGVTSIEPDTYVKLTQGKAALEKKISELAKKTSKENTKKDAMLTAVAELNEAWHAEFKQISTALTRINAAQPALKVDSAFKGDKAAFVAKMEETFRGNNIRKDTYQAIAEKYVDFASICSDLENAAGHAKSKAQTFKEIFSDKMSELLCFQVPNSYEITYHGKPLKSHSLGQRASAMMLFLLSQDENDLLLIDQPEDDLDSQTVYEEVVKLIRKLKPRQQFIFATHNANFPVLGDAELVAASRAEEDRIIVESGSIDTKSCQSKIVTIMEGGIEAFERRKAIYQAWKGASSA